MTFTSCPECGDTNFDEDQYGYRSFDCGFKSYFDRRVTRCKGKKVARVVERIVDDSASRYRLALLDAAQALDGIAGDMQSGGVEDAHTERCRELAQQMRTLAGLNAQFGEQATQPTKGTSLVAFFKRKWR